MQPICSLTRISEWNSSFVAAKEQKKNCETWTMGEPDNKTVKIQDEVIDIPDHRDEDDVHAEVCIHPGRHREDSGFSNGEEDDAQHRLSELEDKLYRRCFDKVRLFFWFLFYPNFFVVQISLVYPNAEPYH